MSDSTPAVFLSYAREDTDAARRIADALRSHGVEVWLDQSELRGGDAWDAKIRKQINDCTLFLPVISANTQSRGKGYFRLEWKLAVEQTHLMAEGMAFLAPVVIDETAEGGALVPPEFLRVQWTRLPGALPTPAFVAQVKRLLSKELGAGSKEQGFAGRENGRVHQQKPGFPHWGWWALVVAIMAVAALVLVSRRSATAENSAPPPIANHSSPAALPAPIAPAKSIAVLPFANLSTEKENEFFADGVHDDVITNLAKIRDLKVISRTSVLAYRDPASRNLKKIAAELGVATILEGSIRRVGNRVHMNAQLIDARTDEHLWADTFEGDTGDIFALQASLSQKIAAALKATLTPDERTLIERRPTENQEAYELYTRARLLEQGLSNQAIRPEYEAVISLYEQAVARDPGFALVFARLTITHGNMYWFAAVDPTPERLARAEAALATAQRLAPDAPETHLARGAFAYLGRDDWVGALAEFAVAEQSLPNDAQLQFRIGLAQRRLGQWTEAAAHVDRAVLLNPHDLSVVTTQVEMILCMRRYAQARALAARYMGLFPRDRRLGTYLVRSVYALDGDRTAYLRSLAALPAIPGDTFGLQRAYDLAWRAGDLAAADRALADPRLTGIITFGNIIVEPPVLHRAQVAWLRDQHDAAREFAAQAIAFYRRGAWTPRQQPEALMGIARAEACAGQTEDALRDGRAALASYVQLDAFVATVAKLNLGRIYLMLGRRDEALEKLRSVASEVEGSMTPAEIRGDPLWSRLKDDPRFEEILKSAKPL